MTSDPDIGLRVFEAGDLEWMVRRHGALYRDSDGFDDSFAPLVRGILDDFVARYDPRRERGWIAEVDGRRVGSIFCVRTDAAEVAKLRLFLLEPEVRGRGLGRTLLQACLAFAQGAGYRRMTLWTHESHRAACRLYARTGFDLTDSRPVRAFGCDLVEQHWQIDLPLAGNSRSAPLALRRRER